MQVETIIESKDNFVEFLHEKGFQEEKQYFDEEYKNGKYFKIDRRKLLVVYDIEDENKLKEIKDHFLIDRGLSYCIIYFKNKLIFFRSFGETKHFIYSQRTKNKISKIDKLKNIDKSFDSIFQTKDISAQFYESFKLKRNILVQNIKNEAEPLEKYLLSQKIFDRIFFIYFLCHKGILKFKNGEKISGENLFCRILLKNGEFLENLKKLFKLFNSEEKDILEIGEYQIKIPYLNGGLFRPDVLEQDLEISLTDNQWEDIFDFLNSYHWIIEDVKVSEENEDKILTPEILGHVYERSVIEWEQTGLEEEAENILRRITERKKKGVYYTPEPITDYISNNTVIPSLLDKLNNNYKSFDELIESKNVNDFEEAIQILDKISILDPACGSGAFLVKASELIYFLKRRLLHELDKNPNFYNLKLDIITENIYGVDILSGAIEISKLRLWLWLISDFDDSQNEIQALPNIEYNLKVGNSLLGWLNEKLVQIPLNTPLTDKIDGIFTGLIAFSDNGHVGDLKKARKYLKGYNLNEYIEAYYILYKVYRKAHGLKAQNLRSILETIRESIYSSVTPAFLDYINCKLSGIDVNDAYKKQKKKYESMRKNPPIKKEDFKNLKVFHWKIDFGHIILNGGFDIIVSTPPYVKEYSNRKAFDGIRWSDYYMGKMDIWYFFACRSLDLLIENQGYMSFIAQNNWVTSYGAKIMRNKVIDDSKIIQMLDFGDFKIFKDAGIQTMIMIFKPDKESDDYFIDYRKLNYSKNVDYDDVLDLLNRADNDNVEYLQPKINRKEKYDSTLSFHSKKITELLSRIEEKSNFKLESNEMTNGIHHHHDKVNKDRKRTLKNAFEIGQGIFTLNSKELKELNLPEEESVLIKPEYTTKELSKYYANSDNTQWVIYTDSSFKNPEKIKKYPRIKKHLDQFKEVITSDFKPYGLHRSRDEKFFNGEKIISVRKCCEPTFTYTDFNCYVSATFYVIKSERINMKYLTAFLNSKLAAFWFKNEGKMQGNNFQIDKEPLLKIPIYFPSEDEQKPIISIVDKIIELIKSGNYKKEKVEELQNQIDILIYNLYKLNEDEIEIINNSLN